MQKYPLILANLLFTSSISLAAEFDYPHSYDLKDYSGQTYLSFMQQVVKPAIDEVATEGYVVCDAAAIESAYEAAAPKVQGKVKRSFGGLDNVIAIVAQLEGETVTHADLPSRIRAIDRDVDIYDLSTFIGLACGGGVKVNYNSQNYALNVHYDTTEQRSGRSFGVGPTRAANDASDKEYLDDLEQYARSSRTNLPMFYQVLFEALLNSDPSNLKKVAPEGQTVLTDFLAVFTAEQARNLMDDEVSPHWDAALLEVTLLASFHAGQKSFKLYYKDPNTGETSFTGTTYAQTPCQLPSKEQPARMRDYWQFSRNIDDPRNCKRSGINITKSEFRQLGEEITSYLREYHPDVLNAVTTSMGIKESEKNIFRALSYYLISGRSPASFSKHEVRAITKAWTELLSTVTESAKEITNGLSH